MRDPLIESGNSKRGFTLIELLIVIAIILILISIALPNFLEAQLRAKITSTKGCLQAYRTAQESYHTDFKMYVPDVDGSELVRGAKVTYAVKYGAGARIDCGASEICTYRMLTTPIPYMKRPCYEIFYMPLDKAVSSKRLNFFEYATIWAQGAGPGGAYDTYEAGSKYGIYYVFVSVGPDRTYNYNYSNQAWEYIGSRKYFGSSPAYSPTNGTLSVGDIIVSNRGHEG